MNKRKRITVTFGEYDDDVYNFLQSQKNASALIRYLVRAYINNESVVVIQNSEPNKKESIVEKDDEKEYTKSAQLDLEKARELAVDFEL